MTHSRQGGGPVSLFPPQAFPVSGNRIPPARGMGGMCLIQVSWAIAVSLSSLDLRWSFSVTHSLEELIEGQDLCVFSSWWVGKAPGPRPLPREPGNGTNRSEALLPHEEPLDIDFSKA